MQGLNVDQERLDTLVEINSLINSNFLDLNLLLSKIVESASRLVDGEAASLLLYNSDSQKLHFEVALGIKAEEVRKFSLKIGEGIAGWVVQNSRALIVNDVAADERFQAEISPRVEMRIMAGARVQTKMKFAGGGRGCGVEGNDLVRLPLGRTVSSN